MFKKSKKKTVNQRGKKAKITVFSLYEIAAVANTYLNENFVFLFVFFCFSLKKNEGKNTFNEYKWHLDCKVIFEEENENPRR